VRAVYLPTYNLAPAALPVRTFGVSVFIDFIVKYMILSDVLNCTVPPLRVESSVLKHPIPPKKQSGHC